MILPVYFFVISNFLCEVIAFDSSIFNGINTNEISDGVEYDPDVDLPTLDMIKRAGYPAEGHVVVTEDGYLLTMHRIPGQPGSKPIMLQHGLLSSSADWVIPGKNKSLPYILADKGYDVWLGNLRGNTYSRAHTTLSIKDSKFWNFSWHEMGLYDLPAMVEYITRLKNDKILYVGHSMGTTVFYVMATQRRESASKIEAMFSLAPVAFMNHLKSPIRLFAPFSYDLQWVIHCFGKDEFLPQNWFLKILERFGCEIYQWEEEVCTNTLFTICGYDKDQFNETLLPVILSHAPAGTSTKTLVHYAQEIMSGKFRPYDYGAEKNMLIYNSTAPPDYDLSVIEEPIYLLYADNDWLASSIDVKRLYRTLPNKKDIFRVPFAKFNHLDFLWGVDAPSLVYKKVFNWLDEYQITPNSV